MALAIIQETCPMCGFVFDPSARGCSSGCPLASGCRITCCPQCLYSYPQEGRLAGALRRILGRSKQERP